MDPVILSRLQFALATFFHFIYVPLTLGLSIYIAIMHTRWYKTGDDMYKRQAKFWGKIFLINFALGVVTGITLEFQFGTNWANYSRFVGDIFGSLLAIEATVAFFLESTFIAVWVFGWNRVPKKLHLASIWLVAGAGSISALWIILANGFMQNPVGYHIEGGRAVLASFTDVLTNPYGWAMYLHTLCGALLLAGFFVMGVSAWHLFRQNEAPFFHKAFKLGLSFALIFSLLTLLVGHQLGQITYEKQPAKLAAMEALWETQEGAPMHLLTIPPFSSDQEENLVEWLPIPGFMSFLATNDFKAEVKGLKDFPKDERPQVWPVFYSFRLMVALGALFILVSLFTFTFRNRIPGYRWRLWIYILMIPLPYLALQLGWIVTEMGRQPWIVYGLMKTSMAGSPVDWYQVAGSLAVMLVVYSILTLIGLWLMARAAVKGPQAADENGGAY